MNILVDARTLCRYAAGVDTFFRGALLQWAECRPNDHFILLIPNKIDSKAALPYQPHNVEYLKLHTNFILSRLPNVLRFQAIVPYLCRKHDIALYFSPVPFMPMGLPSKVKTLITIHDVVLLEYGNTMSWKNILASTLFFRPSIKRSDFIWCNSLYTKGKVNEYFPVKKCKSIYVGCGVNRSVYNLVEPNIKYKNDEITDRFVLFVGSLEPRKNLPFLLSLVPELYEKHNIQLVIVGGNKWKDTYISSIVHQDGFPKKGVHFCEYINDYELADLYHRALCFVSASLNEGFGMPQLEAMLCGCRVVTAHNSAMVEIAQNNSGALTVKGYDKKEWIEAILKMSNTKLHVNQDILSKFNWEVVVPEMLDNFKL